MQDPIKKPAVLILGTFHMRPTTDMYQSHLDDLRSDKRQQEIREVVDRIKRFNPTKIAVENFTQEDERLNQSYQAYRAGELELDVNEVHQIGFRMAAELNHEKLYAIDWKGAGKRSVGEVYEWAKTNQPELFNFLFKWLETDGHNKNAKTESTILDIYRKINEPEEVKKHHHMYINMARIGEIDNYVGMDWLIWWYQRNLILFSNIARLASSADDRILFLVGSGHVQILQQFLEESGMVEIVSAMTYLGDE